MKHIAVLLNESLKALDIKADCWYLDATLGAGGHTEAILKDGAKVIAVDFDQEAVKHAKQKFANYIQNKNLILIKNNFNNLKKIINNPPAGGKKITGVLFDFGTSSDQLTDPNRGLSFIGETELDMRLDRNLGVKAKDLLALLSEKQLASIFKNYGGEEQARKIAQEITKLKKQNKFIKTNQDLVNLIFKIKKIRPDSNWKIHPATKVFQALRIAVNMELENIKQALPQALEILQPKGRVVAISFHSGEDKIVKNYFKNWQQQNLGQNLTAKPITASQAELELNPRARSAKLRIFEKN